MIEDTDGKLKVGSAVREVGYMGEVEKVRYRVQGVP